MQQITFELPELDRKQTQSAVEAALEKYRLYRYLTFEEREASLTAGYTERFHGPTNVTSDQTASISIHNVDVPTARKKFRDKIEAAVRRLPPMERFLLQERYMCEDAEYITDYNVYTQKFQPPISEGTYTKIRWKAFYKLALALDIAVEKGGDSGSR
ncbi:ArpU family phage packaging/lysis transcriptional regulator [Cohnella yongneupensis]|uniref:ArpU family phage packaging/lysis transcriptional regulator n=1 Tax=Cohnella yongneupensis TaxID=425006 RepID=A0ABW0QUA9_9BACL